MRLFLLILVLAVLSTSCDESEREPLNLQSTYNGQAFQMNASSEITLVDQLNALTNEAKKGRTPGIAVAFSDLNTLYTAGSLPLKSASTPYFAGKMEGPSGFMNQLALSSGGTYTPGVPSGQGGTFGGYLFDENGLELEQLVEKGNFGAVLYNTAISLANGPRTEALADRLLALFGATPAFSNSGSTNVAAAVRDRALANYAARRDKNDGNGLYSLIKADFIKLQSALKAGDRYRKEQDDALVSLFDHWEKVNAATVINYCHTVISTMSATTTTDAQKASALHAYAEAVGFLHGWRALPTTYRRLSDARIDTLLTLLRAPYNGTPASYLFITQPAQELPKLQQVLSELQTVYGFSDAQMNDFRNNWVTVQNR